MKSNDWASIKHFSATEAWGDVARISPGLVRTLDQYRDFIDTKIIITCGTQGAHTEGSQHYLGTAVDVVFPDISKKDLFDLFIAALRFPFNGVGMYPHWKPYGGLHLDVRSAPSKALWLARLDGEKQVYIDFKLNELKKDKVI